MRKVSQQRKKYLLKRSKDLTKKHKEKKKLEKLFNQAVEMGLISFEDEMVEDDSIDN